MSAAYLFVVFFPADATDFAAINKAGAVALGI